MEHQEKLLGAWVEIQERGDDGRVVLMRPDAGVPPSRGGRRRLEIDAEGHASSMAQGATDRMETSATGAWDMHDDIIDLKLDGWEGEYNVEKMTDTELILNRR